jgi:hypothetical protein
MAERYKNQTANHENKLTEELYVNGPVTRRLTEHGPKTSSITEIDYMKEKHHWTFPLHVNHLQHLYLILCNDLDCKVTEIIIIIIYPI